VPTANPLIGTTTQFDGHTTQFETASTSKQAATAKSQQQQHKHDDDELADHLRVVLRGEGLTRASTKQLADFVVDGSDARRGRLFVIFISMSCQFQMVVRRVR
jgi:hypothetical protein